VCAPAVATAGLDYFAHWGLVHFLLDGHHKVEAAAEAGLSLQVLSLLCLDASLADGEQIEQALASRAAPARRRVCRP